MRKPTAHCIDCDKLIWTSHNQLRCKSCSLKGSLNPNWNPHRIRTCKLCGSKVSKNSSGLCQPCYRRNIPTKLENPLSKGRYQPCLVCDQPVWVPPCYFGIKKLCSSKCKSIYWSQKTGDKNFNWRGGSSFGNYPSGFNRILKEIIRKRCGRVCLGCGKMEEDELRSLNKKLSVHHVDYNKDNLNLNNLILLCSSCNSKANANRPSWTYYYQVRYGLLQYEN